MAWKHKKTPNAGWNNPGSWHSVTVWAFQSVVLLLLTDGIMNVDWKCFHLSINSRNYFCLFSKPNIKNKEGPETFHAVCLHVIDLGRMNVDPSPFHHMSKLIQLRCLSVLCQQQRSECSSALKSELKLLWRNRFVCGESALFIYIFCLSQSQCSSGLLIIIICHHISAHCTQ